LHCVPFDPQVARHFEKSYTGKKRISNRYTWIAITFVADYAYNLSMFEMNYIWVLPPKLWTYRKGDVKFCKVAADCKNFDAAFNKDHQLPR
jgi:hypothetical protein